MSSFSGTSTNVGRTIVGRHKRRTVQTSDAQMSDQYKRRTSTNFGLVQTSDWYKCRTGTFIRKVFKSEQRLTKIMRSK